jgi:LmbE family N-acetylglucosaminyl deacetylase
MQAASPRTLLIAAHPDDETVGAAILISQSPGIRVVHVTEGSPPDPADALAAGYSPEAMPPPAARKLPAHWL